METAYGDPSAAPAPDDLVAFLGWARAERARRQPARSTVRFPAPPAR